MTLTPFENGMEGLAGALRRTAGTTRPKPS
jgi:hypothetical protein